MVNLKSKSQSLGSQPPIKSQDKVQDVVSPEKVVVNVRDKIYAEALSGSWSDPAARWQEFSKKLSAELLRDKEAGKTGVIDFRSAIDTAFREAVNHASRKKLSFSDAAQSIVRGAIDSAPTLGPTSYGHIQYATQRALKTAIQSGVNAAIVLEATFLTIREGSSHSEVDLERNYAAGIQGAKDCCMELDQEQSTAVYDWVDAHPRA